ncbi:MAG: tetratricopeptide repeat protein [Phycisphaerae bacterium]|nr:tetratricopeptide repeat protein [Phycisphaerae bacterium]
MDAMIKDQLDALVQQDTWTFDDYQRLLELLFETSDAASQLRQLAGDLGEVGGATPTGSDALKLGMVHYALCDFARALDVLNDATDNKDRRYVQAMCYKHLGRYEDALGEIDRAQARGWDPPEDMDLARAELLALSGDLDAAAKQVKALEKSAGEMAQWHYVRGLVDELAGYAERAGEAYIKARDINPTHAGATFRLAYFYDLHGHEEEAVELYKECIARPPVYTHALLNLAVLLEDAGRYDEAARAVRSVLAANPNHLRARLFLRDIRAAKNMYYDEDQARRLARRNAVLDIPVTDFELSVRARNCLKKMNIHTLGDLIRTTESELLGYKNFGETSLTEIKDMLAAKGLHLGQALEDDSEYADLGPRSPEIPLKDDGLLSKPIEDLNLSIRAARALETLGVTSLGELVQKSEAELLACKNFGQTSLNEIRERLAEHDLSLRENG